ncbi:GTPase-activating protein CdGAPr [Choristoneura fumiferana]|uniref:GTPase-activating protein CdGAPr n=1 Tax=Choristoneura fumiferana TaxID=7141 RepID=UPI003D153EFF
MRRVFGVCSESWYLCGQNGSPHGSVMSCQSLAARAFSEPDKTDVTHCSGFHRSVRFSSESRSSTRASNDADCKRETPGSISLTALSLTPVTSQGNAMSQSVPAGGIDDDSPPPPAASCRFPKLEECAHFHYERVCLGTVSVEPVATDTHGADSPQAEGWITLKVRSHVSWRDSKSSTKALHCSWSEASDVREWTLARNAEHCKQFDHMLHKCIYDRKVSGLPNLTEKIDSCQDETEYRSLIADYMHHFSIIADDTINCGPLLNWLQMDNKGHKLLVANEDSSSINTPAVAAAYSVRKYVSQARDEISFEVGDMISIIDMPGPQESTWWRGKRGFRVGFFPHHCVAVIGDKVPRHMTQPPPIVGSVAVAPIKPVLRKHGKLISLFRSFILSRPSRRRLKQQGILRERVFGCDLGEHLLNFEHDVPLVLVECAKAIEARGAVDGIYRLSGGSGLTQRLRADFDSGTAPPPPSDPHATASLLKMYFRELPNPLCTYQLYESFVAAVQTEESKRLKAVRDVVVKLPPPHYRTLAYLMRHLRRVSLLGEATGMTARNMAIVWAPNLLRSPRPQHALQHVAVQAVVTEFLICYAEELFAEEQDWESGPESLDQEQMEQVELRGHDSCRRPKSLPLNPPTKLLSLEEARRRERCTSTVQSPRLPAPSGAIAAAAAETQLRPSGHLRPKYIEVGSGPDNLPQYHTVLDLPLPAKRGLKRSPSGWRGLFSRTKQQRHKMRAPPPPLPKPVQDIPMVSAGLRPVKSCESLASDSDTVAPLAERALKPLKHHTRSSSCDSYFEPWQAELADMRLRLSPQERDRHMFSEEDDTHNCVQALDDSLCSTPAGSGACSVDPSPRRNLRVDIEAANELAERKRSALEEQLATIGYIDGDSPRGKPAEKRHSARPDNLAKRLCKDRDSPTSLTDFQNSITNVKLRERASPKKTKAARYSNVHPPVMTDDVTVNSRLSWHGKDGHSTLIRIDWPIENSASNLTTSTLNSSPLTPITPAYDPLESDSEVSETNKRTITISNCDNCEEEKCLKCELKAADYENIKIEDYTDTLKDSLETSPANSANISYHNLNRLSAVSTSSASEGTDKKKEVNYENCEMKVMTSSHGSSSTYSNISPKTDEPYECYSFSRPNYINLQSSSSKSSPGSPLKSPLKSTISITFRSPTKKSPDYEPIENETPTNERDSVYEDIDLEKNLSIVEEATVPETDASLPTQQACQPDNFNDDLIILETPTDSDVDNTDVYSQVKFFKKSIEEVNAMILESPPKENVLYENVTFGGRQYENVALIQKDNGNTIKIKESLNVRELAHRFESPTEQKGPFFEKFKTEVKYPEKDEQVSPKCFKLSKNSANARSLDENAFVKEFGNEKTYVDRRKSLEVKDVKKQTKFLPDLDLNLNMEENDKHVTTPTTENKISLIQRFDTKKVDLKNMIGFDTEKKLSRERIEKYKEERRNFLREKYSSQSFRSNPEQLTRIKLKKEDTESPKFERRNTVDLGQRMRFSLARSSHNLDTIPSPTSPERERVGGSERVSESERGESSAGRNFERKEKISPSYNIRDMAAIFEQKSQSTNTG